MLRRTPRSYDEKEWTVPKGRQQRKSWGQRKRQPARRKEPEEGEAVGEAEEPTTIGHVTDGAQGETGQRGNGEGREMGESNDREIRDREAGWEGRTKVEVREKDKVGVGDTKTESKERVGKRGLTEQGGLDTSGTSKRGPADKRNVDRGDRKRRRGGPPTWRTDRTYRTEGGRSEAKAVATEREAREVEYGTAKQEAGGVQERGGPQRQQGKMREGTLRWRKRVREEVPGRRRKGKRTHENGNKREDQRTPRGPATVQEKQRREGWAAYNERGRVIREPVKGGKGKTTGTGREPWTGSRNARPRCSEDRNKKRGTRSAEAQVRGTTETLKRSEDPERTQDTPCQTPKEETDGKSANVECAR
uniref:Uncharacterized protein n=1 Tax=Knipowitschia caucasica TaxID=637954 RepID=A0AAV2J8Q3_KNICA